MREPGSSAADPKITMLAWVHIDQSKPPKQTCLFTDGYAEFWTGWYSPTDGCIYVKGPDFNQRLETNRVVWWAKLNNLMPILTP